MLLGFGLEAILDTVAEEYSMVKKPLNGRLAGVDSHKGSEAKGDAEVPSNRIADDENLLRWCCLVLEEGECAVVQQLPGKYSTSSLI